MCTFSTFFSPTVSMDLVYCIKKNQAFEKANKLEGNIFGA
jgi:hypothetical protein